MAMEFGWWVRSEDEKYQVKAVVHGGNLTWTRKQGHFSAWEPHVPSEDDWDRLMADAGKRVPRRLLSEKQMAQIRNLRTGR